MTLRQRETFPPVTLDHIRSYGSARKGAMNLRHWSSNVVRR
jgi:hypothetical protein